MWNFDTLMSLGILIRRFKALPSHCKGGLKRENTFAEYAIHVVAAAWYKRICKVAEMEDWSSCSKAVHTEIVF